MIVSKAVVLNTIEPSALSFRTPMGIETKLDVTFYGQNGSLYTQDLAAQLQLTARSSDRTQSYLMPSTDIVNGKARATIPADSLTDPNGYRLRLVGTFKGEPTLLAMGNAIPIAAAGMVTVEDTIDAIDLTFERNEIVELDVNLWKDTSKSIEFNLTTTTISASVCAQAGGITLVPFTVTVIDNNTVKLSLTVEQVNALPDSCWWTMTAAAGGGLTTLAQGNVTVTGTITQPLVDTTASYNYSKPNDAEPVSGQIVHGNYTQNILKVAKLDNGGVDRSAMLALIIPGDQIVIDVVTWTVGLAYEASGWYEFKVLPVQQAAVTGVTPVTFKRPVA